MRLERPEITEYIAALNDITRAAAQLGSTAYKKKMLESSSRKEGHQLVQDTATTIIETVGPVLEKLASLLTPEEEKEYGFS